MKRLEKRIASKILIIVLTGVVISILATLIQAPEIDEEYKNNVSNEIPTQEIVKTREYVELSSVAPSTEKTQTVGVPMPDVIPPGVEYPKPELNVPLRKYDINKDDNTYKIWRAQDPSSYITPNNEWVKYVASQLYIDENGRIRYKNKPIPYMVDINGSVLYWTDEHFFNNYVHDDELFNFPANADLWQNADYYLSHGMRGDCEDWSIAITSMMLSGEMSIKENNTYIRQVIPAKSVIGHSGTYADIWTQYTVYNRRYISSTGLEFNPDVGKYVSVTTFHQEGEWDGFEPIYQFTDRSFEKYG